MNLSQNQRQYRTEAYKAAQLKATESSVQAARDRSESAAKSAHNPFLPKPPPPRPAGGAAQIPEDDYGEDYTEEPLQPVSGTPPQKAKNAIKGDDY